MPKKKSYIKTNIIAFTIIGLLFTGIGVYAAVTFPSNEVSYDNTSSGLKSNNVKGAIDELYKECTQTAADKVIEDGQLEKDPYECRYFFTGANPNNYITFNGEKAGWRIISAECDGTIKIIKNDSIGNMVYDSYNGYWNYPASLNSYLNGTYLNELNTTTKNYIVLKSWSIGSISNVINNDLENQIKNENSGKYSSTIGLITPSEYLRTNSNVSQCGTLKLNNDNHDTCKDTNWLYDGTSYWTITPTSSDSESAYIVSGGLATYSLGLSNKDRQRAVRPVVYLSSNLKLSGSGTQSAPYTIA